MEQITMFDYLEERSKKIRPCECGNDRLAVRYTGCGIPTSFVPVTYEKYLFCVFCPSCYRVAMAGDNDGAWRSNKPSIEKAVKDWNVFRHRIDTNYIKGKFGHEYYAGIMEQTLERFPNLREYFW